MASIKILLWGKANSDGEFPIALRIIKNRKPSYMYIGHYVEEKHWDKENRRVKKSHPNSTRLNNLISKKLAEANDTLLNMETSETDVSSKVIKANIKPKGSASFFSQADIYIENLHKEGKYNRVTSEKPRIKHFKEFLKGQDIPIQEISVPLLRKFRAYLKAERKISERTIINHLILIRTVYNQAIAAKIIDSKNYPFGKGKISIKFPESTKLGLSLEEVQKIEALDLSDNPRLNHARNIWLFSFYFAGVRISDVFRMKWSDIQNNRLLYVMGKNGKTVTLRVPEKALAILSQCSHDNKHDLIFPDLSVVQDMRNLYEVQRQISFAAKRLRTALNDLAKLAGVKKKMGPHIARHTFGELSGDKISIQMLQKLYRHTVITTTIGYQANFLHKDADEALDAVVSF